MIIAAIRVGEAWVFVDICGSGPGLGEVGIVDSDERVGISEIGFDRVGGLYYRIGHEILDRAGGGVLEVGVDADIAGVASGVGADDSGVIDVDFDGGAGAAHFCRDAGAVIYYEHILERYRAAGVDADAFVVEVASDNIFNQDSRAEGIDGIIVAVCD